MILEELIEDYRLMQEVKRQSVEKLENLGLSPTCSDLGTLLVDSRHDKEALDTVYTYHLANELLKKLETSKETGFAVAYALWISEAISGLEHAKLIPDIKRGKKVLSGSQSGHKSVHGSDEEKKERWKAYQDDVDKLYKDEPGIKSFTQLSIRVAKIHNVDPKTIRRRTKNPIKK